MDSVPSRVEDILLALINNSEYDGPIISRVEQILYSFLENSEYAADPESRVEAILVALKAAGLYNDEVISRIEKILCSKLNGTEYTAEPESRVEELLLEWELIEEKELTGVVPLLFNADGTPLLDYLVSGNTVQSGTPTPDNPIMPEGVGESTGNLLPPPLQEQSGTLNGITYHVHADGSVDLSGIAEEDTSITIVLSSEFTIPVAALQGGGGTIALNNSFTNASSIILRYGSTIIDSWGFTVRNRTVSSYVGMANKTINRYSIGIVSGTNLSSGGKVGLAFSNNGTPVTPYEPYGYKIPISSANTTTPVYLGEVETTRKIKKLVLTGGEIWNTHRNTYYIAVSDYYRMYDIGSHLSVCSHYPDMQILNLPEMHYGLGGLLDGSTHTVWNGNIVFNPSPMISSLTDWKSYLQQQYAAGTPVTVWYVLATEQTAVVNEPLMKIGDYADTLSMEQAGVEIPTVNGENTLDVLTTVKPSEVYIKYKGR